MAWQAAAAGISAAYNIYNFDQQYNSGRLGDFVRNRRRRNPSVRMPRGMSIYGKRRRVGDGPGVGNVSVTGGYVNDVHWKRQRTLGRVNVKKLSKQGVDAYYDRWQAMSPYSSLSGNLWLTKNVDAVSENGVTLANYKSMPLYMWDLTSARNYVNGADTIPDAAYQLVLNTVSGIYHWTVVRGQKIDVGTYPAAGVGSKQNSTWQLFKTPRISTVNDHPLNDQILDWVKCQFVFSGTKKTSHKIWVQVVQLDDLVQPAANEYTPGTADLSTVVTSMARDENSNYMQSARWYGNKMNRLIDGPFATSEPTTRRFKETILDQKVLEFNPTASYEENGAALVHKQTLNMFLKMGRRCRYDWKDDEGAPPIHVGDGDIETSADRGVHFCYVDPKARVFLRVMSQVYADRSVSYYTADQDVFPSFDVRITRKWLHSTQ